MGLLVTKNIQILKDDNDFYYKIGREGAIELKSDEISDVDFDTYFISNSKDTVIYTMVLPIQVEENLKTVINSFVSEKVPSDNDYKVDYSYIKDKGKLKILISVLKQEKYDEIRNFSYGKADKLSGIFPIQVLFYMFAMQKGIKEGLCVFQENGSCVCFYVENGFPLNFVRVKSNGDFIASITRIVSSLRKNFDECKKHFFGCEEDMECDLSMFSKYTEGFSIADTIVVFEKSKQIPNLNLLPVKERKVNRKIWKYIFMTAGLLVSLFYVFQFAGDYRNLKSELSRIEIKLKKEKVSAMQLGKTEDEIDKLQTNLNFLLKYEKQKKKVLLALSEITALSPDDTYATSIKINDNNDEIEITGKSKNVYELQRSLSKSKYIKEVTKPGTVRKDKDGYDTFVMRGNIVF